MRLVDGHDFAVAAAGATGPLLVGQCDRPSVLSDIKLSVEEGPTVTVLQRLGLPDEAVTEVAWADLDRAVEPDHLTSLWIPGLAEPVAAELERFAGLVRRLRAECPWDREQTHQSLTRHLVEESYEVLDAIDLLAVDEDEGYVALEEELGDLLFQVFFHATLGAEEGRFTLADVARGVHDKLVARHPHVFGDVEVDGADDVVTNWESIKKAEKGRESVFDGIPRGSAGPALRPQGAEEGGGDRPDRGGAAAHGRRSRRPRRRAAGARRAGPGPGRRPRGRPPSGHDGLAGRPPGGGAGLAGDEERQQEHDGQRAERGEDQQADVDGGDQHAAPEAATGRRRPRSLWPVDDGHIELVGEAFAQAGPDRGQEAVDPHHLDHEHRDQEHPPHGRRVWHLRRATTAWRDELRAAESASNQSAAVQRAGCESRLRIP